MFRFLWTSPWRTRWLRPRRVKVDDSLFRHLRRVALLAVGFPAFLAGLSIICCFAVGQVPAADSLVNCCYLFAYFTPLLLLSGFVQWRVAQLQQKAERKRAARRQAGEPPCPLPDPAPEAPHAERLARFLKVAPAEIGQPRPSPSRMKYWALPALLIRHGPKSPAWIRQILERIRRAVHGDPANPQRP